MLDELIDRHNNKTYTKENNKINKKEYLDSFYDKYIHKGTTNLLKLCIVGSGMAGVIGLIALGFASSGVIPAAIALAHFAKFALIPVVVNLWRALRCCLGEAYKKSWKRSLQKELWSVYNFAETILRAIPVVAKTVSCITILAISPVILALPFILDIIAGSTHKAIDSMLDKMWADSNTNTSTSKSFKFEYTKASSKLIKDIKFEGAFKSCFSDSHFVNKKKADFAREIGTGIGDFEKLNKKAKAACGAQNPATISLTRNSDLALIPMQ